MRTLYRLVLPCLVTALGLGLASQAFAKDDGYLNTIQEPNPARHLYPVRIDLIDGHTPLGTMGGRANISVDAGNHKIVAWMNLANRWLNNVALPPENKWGMEFELEIEEGVTYILAGKAVPKDEQKPGGPLWEPIVYRAHGHGVNYKYGDDPSTMKKQKD